jgi:hypothetical protein
VENSQNEFPTALWTALKNAPPRGSIVPHRRSRLRRKQNRTTAGATRLKWRPIKRKRVAPYGRYLTLPTPDVPRRAVGSARSSRPPPIPAGPLRIVCRANPVAADTNASPPNPIARDSPAAHSRRDRSSRSSSSTTYLATTVASRSTSRCVRPLDHNSAVIEAQIMVSALTTRLPTPDLAWMHAHQCGM